MALKQAKIITITSVKGGVGKTTLALFLSRELSLDKKRVLILDADLYGSAVAMASGANADKNLFNFVDDLKNNRFIGEEDYITKYDDYLSILPSLKDPRGANKIGGRYLKLILSKLRLRYDYIIIDTNHMMDEFKLVALDESDLILYVISSDPIDLKNMRTMLSIFSDIGKENYKVILNETVRDSKNYLSNYDMKHLLHGNIDYIIPSSFLIKNIDSYIVDGKMLSFDDKFKNKYKKGFAIINKIKEIVTKGE